MVYNYYICQTLNHCKGIIKKALEIAKRREIPEWINFYNQILLLTSKLPAFHGYFEPNEEFAKLEKKLNLNYD